jgi:A/G-specific adenine glycosylase
VLVSELMLQQTQVARVMAPYATFLDRFPTPGECASAPAADVIRLWAGLGYNRRALLLHRAARAVMADHGGQVPDRLPELLRLPGVGPYTARAVLAFAFERDVAVLDANALRVLSRALGRAVRQADADRLVPSGQGWAWNQAVLDLGATVCRSRPRCESCPLAAAGACAWEAAGRPDPDPRPRCASQPAFEGSDRQGRGRLIQALRAGPVAWGSVPEATGWPLDPRRALRVGRTLVAEGMVVDRGDQLCLPAEDATSAGFSDGRRPILGRSFVGPGPVRRGPSAAASDRPPAVGAVNWG